jgi:hypothetical protein
MNPNSAFLPEHLHVKMRCSTLAIGVLASVISIAPAVQGVPPGRPGTVELGMFRGASTCSLHSPLGPYE